VTIIEAIVLGITQGATEFIPISSSAHLVLVPWLFGWDKPALTFDTTLHLGTLLAVLIYFRKDWLTMLAAIPRWLRTRNSNDPDLKLLGLIILGTIPAAVLGMLFEDFFESLFSQPVTTAAMLFVTAAILVVSERLGKLDRQLETLNWLDSVVVGLAQAAAIIPGISRSGATIAAGRLRNLQRDSAARFSFLLSAPIIFGAGISQLARLIHEGASLAGVAFLVAGFLSAFVSGYLVIWWLLGFLRTRSTYIFALYCVLAGAACLIIALLRGAL